MADLAERTQAPTPRRRQQAREAGQLAHSHDLASAVLLLATIGLVMAAGNVVITLLLELLRGCLSGGAWQTAVDSGNAQQLVTSGWQSLVAMLAGSLLPILLGALVVAVAAHAVQTGFWFRFGRAAPDLSRLSPLTGSARLFSGANLGRMAFGLLKLAAILITAGAGLWLRRERLVELAALPLPDMALSAWQLCLHSLLEIGGVLLVLAVAHYFYQRDRLERSLQMTPQEIREELRELHGDPQVAARRRDTARRRVFDQPHGAGEAAGDRRTIATTPAQIGAVEAI